jgi:hypothetical protein
VAIATKDTMEWGIDINLKVNIRGCKIWSSVERSLQDSDESDIEYQGWGSQRPNSDDTYHHFQVLLLSRKISYKHTRQVEN